MAQNEGAGAEDGDKTGSGAPDGGSPKGGSENDDGLDEKFEKRIKAALANQARQYETRIEGIRAEFESFKEGVGKRDDKPADQPKMYSKAELKALVEAGSITQEQADDRWEQQREAELTAKAEVTALNAVSAKQAKERIDADLAKYKRLAPEILDKGSNERQKIVAEFKELVASGLPDSLATELAAIRAVMGPLEKLDKSRSAARLNEHDEQGGGNSDRPSGKTGKKLVDQLSPRQKAHYQKGIDSRRYKDWNEVEAELKYSPGRVGRA